MKFTHEDAHFELGKHDAIIKFPVLENFNSINSKLLKTLDYNNLIIEVVKKIVQGFKSVGITVYVRNELIYFSESRGFYEEYIDPFQLATELNKVVKYIGVNKSFTDHYDFKFKLLKQFIFGSERMSIEPKNDEGFRFMIKDILRKEKLYSDWKIDGSKNLSKLDKRYLKTYLNGLEKRESLLNI